MKYIFVIAILLNVISARAQVFDSLPPGFILGNPFTLFYDTVDSMLYAGGGFGFLGNGVQVNRIARWNGVQWDSLTSGVNDGGILRTITRYDGKILAGGSFSQIGGVVSKGVGSWNGLQWDYFGDFPSYTGYGSVLKLYVDGNDLYIGGGFKSVNGTPAYGLVRYDGSTFHTYPILDSTGSIGAIAFYNGELYVGGNFDAGGGKNDIAKYDGTNWVSVGGGLSGGNTVVNDMIVFNGELYVSGHFLTLYGDPGNLIAKWNGTNWSQVGGGLSGGNCFDMHIFNNELYAGGSILQAGGVPVDLIAKWDGVSWSSLGAVFNLPVSCFESVNDILYIGGAFNTVNGDTMKQITQYNLITGVNNLYDSSSFEIYPNPVANILNISCQLPEETTQTTIVVNDILGTKVYESINQHVQMIEIDVSHLPVGIFQLVLYDDKLMRMVRKFAVIR